MSGIQTLPLEGGKYELRFDEASGALCAYRHGEPWRDFTGDKFVYLLMQAALAAAPAPAPVAPLTDEQIGHHWRAAYREGTYRAGSFDWFAAGWRKAEAFFGIGTQE